MLKAQYCVQPPDEVHPHPSLQTAVPYEWKIPVSIPGYCQGSSSLEPLQRPVLPTQKHQASDLQSSYPLLYKAAEKHCQTSKEEKTKTAASLVFPLSYL